MKHVRQIILLICSMGARYVRNVLRTFSLLRSREGRRTVLIERKTYILYRLRTAPTYYTNLKSVAFLGLASLPWFLSHLACLMFFIFHVSATRLWGVHITPEGIGTTLGVVLSGLIDAYIATCLLRDVNGIPNLRKTLITIYLIMILCNFLSVATTFGCEVMLGL